MELNLAQAFESTIQPPPTQEGVSIQLNGVNGDKAIIRFRMPKIVRDKTGQVESVTDRSGSERLSLTPKKREEIQASLSALDPQKWQILTKLPSPIFTYSLDLISDKTSPNNAKKVSRFLVTVANRDSEELTPGGTLRLGDDLQINEISEVLASAKLDLAYDMGMYMNFFSKTGEFVSQATGTIIIKPTFFTRLSMFLGVWVLVLALIKLFKETILASNDFKQIKDHYSR
jgi:hypothetical protein